MKRGRVTLARLAAASGLLLGAASAHAALVVVDFDAATEGDFQGGPHLEDGTRTVVDSGHFDVFADPLGPQGDLTMNLDGPGQVTLSVDGGLLFDAVSVDVVNPTDTAGEYTIHAVGGSGSVSVPSVGGTLVFGPGFAGISGLRITQASEGFVAFDDLTLEVLPEPGATARLAASLFAAVWLVARASARRSPPRPER